MNTDNPSWWRYGHVWLLIAGPALVVVAALATAWIAISHPDPVLAEEDYRQGQVIHQTLNPEVDRSRMPAQQARNHAATPSDMPLRRSP